MKVYIAAPYPCLIDARYAMLDLQAAGFEVTSRWITVSGNEGNEWAHKDLQDVARSDVLLALNPPRWKNIGTGGRHVEFGYAHALGKLLVVVGKRSNIFHHLNKVHVTDTVQEAIAWLKQ